MVLVWFCSLHSASQPASLPVPFIVRGSLRLPVGLLQLEKVAIHDNVAATAKVSLHLLMVPRRWCLWSHHRDLSLRCGRM